MLNIFIIFIILFTGCATDEHTHQGLVTIEKYDNLKDRHTQLQNNFDAFTHQDPDAGSSQQETSSTTLFACAICDDGNVCTDDLCDENMKCHHKENFGFCDDQNICTVGNMCHKGICITTKEKSCGNDETCISFLCHSKKGCYAKQLPNCKPCKPNDNCDDEKYCILGHCENKFCKSISTEGIDNMLCDDDNPCTLSDTCKSGFCIGTFSDDQCNDQNACTLDICKKSSGCIHEEITCNDLNPCTKDFCSKLLGCVFEKIPSCVK